MDLVLSTLLCAIIIFYTAPKYVFLTADILTFVKTGKAKVQLINHSSFVCSSCVVDCSPQPDYWDTKMDLGYRLSV